MRRWHMKKIIMGAVAVFFVCGLALSFVLPVNADAGENSPRKIVVFDETVVKEPAQIALVKKFGVTVIKPLRLVNGLAVYLPPQAAEAVLKEQGVLRIDDDVIVHAVAKHK